jgi:hypothetical protein
MSACAGIPSLKAVANASNTLAIATVSVTAVVTIAASITITASLSSASVISSVMVLLSNRLVIVAMLSRISVASATH